MKRSVKGFEGIYSVTQDGVVFNDKTGDQKKPQINYGYEYVCLYRAGVGRQKRVHRLVAEVFIPNPENLPQVNHKNGIKTDNRVDNLEWCTLQDNVKHSWENGLSRASYGEDTSGAKFTNLQVKVIKEAIENKHRNCDIADYFKVDRSTISQIKRGRSWSHAQK